MNDRRLGCSDSTNEEGRDEVPGVRESLLIKDRRLGGDSGSTNEGGRDDGAELPGVRDGVDRADSHI